LRHFRHLWRWLINGKQVAESPWEKISWLKGTPREKTWLTFEQRDRLLAESGDEGLNFQAAVGLVLDTGIRNGELSHLTWQHIDWNQCSVTVAVEPAEPEPWEPKNHQLRVVYFSTETRSLLEGLRASQRAELVALDQIEVEKAERLLQGRRVFGTGRSASHDPYERRFNAQLVQVCRRVGIPEVRAHDLRRTVARLANEAGAYPQDLKALMGHSSFTTTEKYIGRDAEEAASRAHAALSRGAKRAQSGDNSVTPPGIGPVA